MVVGKYNFWIALSILVNVPFFSGAQGKQTRLDNSKIEGAGDSLLPPPDNNHRIIEWQWGTDKKDFDLKTVAKSPIMLEGVSGSVEINGKTYSLRDAKVLSVSEKKFINGISKSKIEYSLAGVSCRWIWELEKVNDVMEITATLRNTGNDPLTIGLWDVVNISKSGGGRFKTEEIPRDFKFFRWKPWDMRVELLNSDNGQHKSDNLCLLFDSKSELTFMSAFVSMDRMHTYHTLNYSPSEGIEDYKATCEFGKYRLNRRKEIVSEKLQLSFQTSPYKALEGWADQIYEIKKPHFAESPPVGLHSIWANVNDPAMSNVEETILNNTRAVRQRLKGFDVRYLWISQTNLKDGIPGNWMKTDSRFPDGLKGFFKNVGDLDFTPGLWVAPFWFCSEADGVLEENKENLLRDCNGKPISKLLNWAGDFGDTIPLSILHRYYLDGTHPKTSAFLKKVFTYYKDIGVGYYMLDFLAVPSNTCLYDPSQTPLEAARNMMELIRKTSGDNTWLQTAVSSTPAYSGLINAARVGRDFGEGRPVQGGALSDWRNATYVLHDEHYANTYYLLQNAAASYFTHRKLYINDLNLLTIDKPIPLEHARIATTIFGLSGSPLMLGDEFSRISEERLNLVKLCLPRTRDVPVPVDLFEHVYPDNYSRYLKLAVNKPWGDYQLVAVFNDDDTAYNAELDFAKLGLDEQKPYRISEFWTEEYCGTYKERFEYVIPPKSCRLFRISAARDYPWLLSTDMHIQQGAVEVEDLRWDEKKRRLSGTAVRPAGEVGNLLFLMPRKMRVVNDEGLFLMKDLNDMNVVIRKEIKFNKSREHFELFFEPWEEKYIVAKPLLPYDTEAEWLDYVEKNRKPGDTRVIE